MQKFGPWDLPGFDYFAAKNPFYGSRENLRFKIVVDGEEFIVFVWSGDLCFEKAEKEIEEHFRNDDDVLYRINDFLSQIFNERKNLQ